MVDIVVDTDRFATSRDDLLGADDVLKLIKGALERCCLAVAIAPPNAPTGELATIRPILAVSEQNRPRNLPISNVCVDKLPVHCY